MRVARRLSLVRAVILLLAAFTTGHTLLLLLRSPIEADASAFVAVLPLFLLPVAVVLVGLVRDSRPLVGAAGALCAFPAIMSGWPIVPFAGFLAVAGLSLGPLPSRRELLRGIAVVVLGLAAWMVPYLGMDPFVPIDAPRIGVGIAMVIAATALATGRRASLPEVGWAQ